MKKETLEEFTKDRLCGMFFNTTTEREIAQRFMNEGAKWQQEQDRWKTVYQETPPIHVELLVQSPEGIIHLASWREYYNIFTCQHNSESSSDWKWKTI